VLSVGDNALEALAYRNDGERSPRSSLTLERALSRDGGLFDGLPVGVYTVDLDGRVVQFNRRAAELWGCEPPQDGSEPAKSPVAEVLRTGVAARGRRLLSERPDGMRLTLLANIDPLFDDGGGVIGAAICFQDVTELARAEEQEKALVCELNHRVKNTLAIVQSLAAQTIRGVGVSVQMREDFEARLLALSRVHDQLSRTQWQVSDLGELVRDVFAPYASLGVDRIVLAGEPVLLRSECVLSIAMVMHELAANAAKYGALSAAEGCIAVTWTKSQQGGESRLVIEWMESGGPAVIAPQRQGFGMRLLERAITQQLRGCAEISFEPSGVRCRIDIPISAPGLR
jgi:PAS domain S-box-containing protein